MFRSKQSRLLCLLFVLILCFQSFGLGVSAASDNLINPDLTTWTDCSGSVDDTFPVTVKKYGVNYYRVQLSDANYTIYMGSILDKTSLVAGHSYTLSFNLPDEEQLNKALGTSFSSNDFDSNFENSSLSIGIGFISPGGEISLPDSSTLYRIEADNYTKFLGKKLNSSFIASNYSGTPCVMICITTLDGEGHYFYFSDFQLIDNDDNSSELTGIKGFLHSIRWDLVGGTCEEEDCPHSSSDNPHLSLSQRMSAGFATMFQDIGNKFEEGSTLNVWFNGLSNKVGSINNGLSNLGNRIDVFFSGLGDRISGFFSNLGDRMSTFFSKLGSDIGGFFSDLKTNMSNWFSELGNKITTKFQEISDKFTEFFEKFKPRVTINFDWRQAWADVSTGIVHTYHKPGQFYEEGSGYCVITDFFEVPSDCTFKLDFASNGRNKVYILKYDFSGKYLGCILNTPSVVEGYLLESGYKYMFQIVFMSDYPSDDEMDDRCNSLCSIYADEGWINALLLNMKNGIKGLFVPDEQAILDWKESLNTLLKDHLGIIYTCSELLTDTLNLAFDIIFDAPDTYEIKIPEVSFEAAGTTVPVFSAQNIDFSFMEKPVFKTMYSMYTVALYIFFGGLEVKYALAVYRKVMNN